MTRGPGRGAPHGTREGTAQLLRGFPVNRGVLGQQAGRQDARPWSGHTPLSGSQRPSPGQQDSSRILSTSRVRGPPLPKHQGNVPSPDPESPPFPQRERQPPHGPLR